MVIDPIPHDSDELARLPMRLRLHVAAEGVNSLGTRASAIVVPIVLAALAGSPLALGVGSAVQWLPIALLGPFLGIFADRFDRRLLLVGSDLVRFLLLFALGVLQMTGALTWNKALAVLLLVGVAHGVSETAQAALVPTLVRPDQLLRANGLIRASETSGRVLGPATASLLLAINPGIALIADAVTYAIAACLRWFVVDPGQTAKPAVGDSLLQAARRGWQTIRQSPVVINLVLIAAMSNVLSATALVSGQQYVFATRELNVSDSTYAWAFGLGAAVGILTGLLGSRLGRRWWIVGMASGLFAFGSGLLLQAAFIAMAPVPILIATVCVYIGGFSLVAVLLRSLLQLSVPTDQLGVVFGYLQVATWGAIPVGSVFGGLLAQLVGTRATIMICGIALMGVAGFTTMRLAANKELVHPTSAG